MGARGPGDPGCPDCSPSKGREPGEQSKSYDTAIRAYDPRIDAWRVTVVAPVYGATVNLIARERDDEIWLEGRSPDNNLVRWTFSQFSDERVLWQGFVSKDEGLTWVRDEEIILVRNPAKIEASTGGWRP